MSRGTVTAEQIIREYSDHPSAYLALNDDTHHFLQPDLPGLVAWASVSRRHVLQLAEPIAPNERRDDLLLSFRQWARGRGMQVTAVELLRGEAERYRAHGFTVNQIGCSFSIALDGYILAGKHFVKTRNKISRAGRAGVVVEESSTTSHQEEATRSELDEVDQAWLRSKEHGSEYRFLIGDRAGRGAPGRRVLVARHEGHIVAYVTFAPVYGSRPGWMTDRTRRHACAPPGALELLLFRAIEQFQAERVAWLHLGLTPLSGMDARHELPGASRWVRQAFRALRRYETRVYPSASQEDYKRKWRPDVVEPEYVAVERATPGPILHMMRVTGGI